MQHRASTRLCHATAGRVTGAADLQRIRGLEERAFNAWPALQTVVADGWVMRFSAGYTKRANSLNAWMPSAPVESILPETAALYRRQGLPLVVRLSPLADEAADAALAARGFARIDETIVMVAPIADGAIDSSVVIDAKPTARWSAGFADANRVPDRHRQTHDAMLAAIRWPAAFASLTEDQRPVAWGLGVAERGMVGLFDIVTSPDVRRRGLGRRLVTSLLAWGRSEGCREAYLQVVATNTPAIALYQALGFREVYRYHYRVEA